MSKQCHDPECIAYKEKFTTHKYKNKEKDPRPSSTSYQKFLDNCTASQKKRQKCAKSKPKHSEDSSKNSKMLFNKSKTCKNKKCHVPQSTSGNLILTYLRQKLRIRSTEPNTCERVSGCSQNNMAQICTCDKSEHHICRSGSLHGHVNSQNVSTERNKRRRRKRSHRRHKKTSKRESDRLRHNCFTTFCICVRGRTSDELRTCKCTSSHGIPSNDHECCCVKAKKKRG
ncbi:uncharacterized protein LOC126848424 [Cataglyphis hispanica]|uniref:uncharacterized protein LOC126848424 n=1 Tax=Cataglyphis hispanica TaxID=1086592 RepID=UPI0021804967|nr:uncharacterized protein LOC126848424 [Cataglyphis hispanica]